MKCSWIASFKWIQFSLMIGLGIDTSVWFVILTLVRADCWEDQRELHSFAIHAVSLIFLLLRCKNSHQTFESSKSRTVTKYKRKKRCALTWGWAPEHTSLVRGLFTCTALWRWIAAPRVGVQGEVQSVCWVDNRMYTRCNTTWDFTGYRSYTT